MAKGALEHEQLGQRGVTDVLTVSFSSNDSVGHTYGPESPEVRDITRQTDRQIAGSCWTRSIGASASATRSWRSRPTTAWHPCPKRSAALRLPGGRFKAQARVRRRRGGARREVRRRARGSSAARCRTSTWTTPCSPRVASIRPRCAAWPPTRPRRGAARRPRVHAGCHPRRGRAPATRSPQRVTRGYHRERSGDLHVVLEPLWTTAADGDLARHAVQLRRPHSADADGAGRGGRLLSRARGAQRPGADAGHAARDRAAERIRRGACCTMALRRGRE